MLTATACNSCHSKNVADQAGVAHFPASDKHSPDDISAEDMKECSLKTCAYMPWEFLDMMTYYYLESKHAHVCHFLWLNHEVWNVL